MPKAPSHRTIVKLAAGGVLSAVIVLLSVYAWRSTNESPQALLARVVETWRAAPAPAAALSIAYPLAGTVFPSEIPPPTFLWDDPAPGARAWLIVVETRAGGEACFALAHERRWKPDEAAWKLIAERSRECDATVSIAGVDLGRPARVLSAGRAVVRTSADPVDGTLFYREVNLPFLEAVIDPRRIRWRFGPVAGPGQPPVVLENLPVCGNCHSFSGDGQTLAMDVDYANSKGSYIITRTAAEMALPTSDIISWDEYKRDDGQLTFGLLSQVSPDGRYVLSTVKDRSVFVPRPDLRFSQLFFPVKGIVAVYDRRTRTFAALPGADDPAFVQSNPTWSPDGKWVVFARSGVHRLAIEKGEVLLKPEECKEFLQEGARFLFDLYRVPFNDGRGGAAEPLAGASGDGKSNYFPKYSPDGRWIVFCKARSFMLLQPDSELFIIPAEGGAARRLECNTRLMNSWHSFTPNGRWLVFSSKANSAYTQLFLTHIDAEGRSTPPVVLDHMTSPDRAANIPEFVALPPGAIARIREEFVNDHSLVRAGNECYRQGRTDDAIRNYEEALRLNAANADAHQKLGFLRGQAKGDRKAGLTHGAKALELDPGNPYAHSDMAMLFMQVGAFAQAEPHFEEALARMPPAAGVPYDAAALRRNFGFALLNLRKYDHAAELLAEALQLAPDDAGSMYYLAAARAYQGALDEPEQLYARAIALDPRVDIAPAFHERLGINYAAAGRFPEAILAAKRGLALARAGGRTELALRLEGRIARYERGLPDGPGQ